jgi:hypothetical protein
MSSSKDNEADDAMKALTELFSDPKLRSKAHFRCSTEGPTEFDLIFETIPDKTFGDTRDLKEAKTLLEQLGL